VLQNNKKKRLKKVEAKKSENLKTLNYNAVANKDANGRSNIRNNLTAFEMPVLNKNENASGELFSNRFLLIRLDIFIF
jgi:hypothetical protein